MIKNIALKLIRFYQTLPLSSSCRFYPSCSQYSYLSIERHGLIKGCIKTLQRLLKCHPFNEGGIDLP